MENKAEYEAMYEKMYEKRYNDAFKKADEKQWLLGFHLSQIAGLIIPLGGILAPLVIWILKKAKYPSLMETGKEILNFQISCLLTSLTLLILVFLTPLAMLNWFGSPVGVISASVALAGLSVALVLVQFCTPLFAAYQVGQGNVFHYPAFIRVIR